MTSNGNLTFFGTMPIFVCFKPDYNFEKGGLIVKTMKFLLAGAVLAATMGATVPASAQRLTIGPDGPGLDFRSRNQRMRDREMSRRDRDDGYYRQQRYRDNDRGYRRDYDY